MSYENDIKAKIDKHSRCMYVVETKDETTT